jgi:hypothetical protein
MEQDLLMHLLATFPAESRNTRRLSRPETQDPDGHLVIRGYRVPFTSPVDDVMLGVLSEFRRSGFSQ